ncbi:MULTISPECIES: hypothetical protein [unclassified Microcoleus]|nr:MULTISPECIES: hypothetical protein [unclassified Microcoleus]
MNNLILISPDRDSGFKPILSGNYYNCRAVLIDVRARFIFLL